MYGGLDLTISIPADDWHYSQRRLKYLETMLMLYVRDEDNIQEWFTATEIAASVLPGLPTTSEAVSRRAGKEQWRKRKARARGTWHTAYHVTSLPSRAFDALLSRILRLPPIDEVVPVMLDLPEMAPPQHTREEPSNTAPPWVLPLVRLMKKETSGNLAEAWQKLPDRLPPGVTLPTVDEAAKVLVRFGLAGS